MDKLSLLAKAVFTGDTKAVSLLTMQLLREGEAPQQILEEHLLVGINSIGRKFRAGEVHVPEVLLSSRALHMGIHILQPMLLNDKPELSRAKVVLGTVAGDLHDIGKKLVGIFFQAKGFQVIDIGVDLTPQDFCAAVRQHQPDFVGISALLTTTMQAMADSVEALDREGLRPPVKIMVGGAPVTEEFAREIGADLYSDDAHEAAEMATKLLCG
ncbi:MAG: cobalamin B12-binding domain-containing protein [bacterium]